MEYKDEWENHYDPHKFYDGWSPPGNMFEVSLTLNAYHKGEFNPSLDDPFCPLQGEKPAPKNRFYQEALEGSAQFTSTSKLNLEEVASQLRSSLRNVEVVFVSEFFRSIGVTTQDGKGAKVMQMTDGYRVKITRVWWFLHYRVVEIHSQLELSQVYNLIKTRLERA
jgi:hypothetical protein